MMMMMMKTGDTLMVEGVEQHTLIGVDWEVGYHLKKIDRGHCHGKGKEQHEGRNVMDLPTCDLARLVYDLRHPHTGGAEEGPVVWPQGEYPPAPWRSWHCRA